MEGSDSLTLGELTVRIQNASTGDLLPTTGFTFVDLDSPDPSQIFSSYNSGTDSWTEGSVRIGGSTSLYGVLVLTTSTTMAGNEIVLTAALSAP